MLVIAAILAGVLTTFVVPRTTKAGALRETRNRMLAHLMEFRLFFDEPALVWSAQLSLLRDNARLFRLLFVPVLILALPMTWLWLQLDARYGHRSLRPGETAVVTAQLKRPLRTGDEPAELYALQGEDILVETPAIRLRHDNQVVWRIRAAKGSVGTVHVTPQKDLAWVSIDYPEKSATWIAWFAAISTAAALLSARWL